MFTWKRFDEIEVTIESKWRHRTIKSDSACQTERDNLPNQVTKSCQIPERNEVQVQTNLQSPVQCLSLKYDQEKVATIDVVALLFFLRKAEKITMREIRHSAQMGSQLQWLASKLNRSEERQPTLDAHLPSIEQILSRDTNEPNAINQVKKWQVSNVVWMENSHQLVIACQAARHDGLCTHVGQLCVWRLQRATRLHFTDIAMEQEEKDLVPDTVLEIESCPCAMVACPDSSDQVIVGAQSGRLLWIDLNRTNTVDTSNVLFQTDPIHLATITGLHFQTCTTLAGNSFQYLLSTALDGQIIQWKAEFNKLTIMSQLSLSLAVLPRSIPLHRLYQTDPTAASKHCVGITCSQLSPHDSNLLIVGSEGGALVQCWTANAASSPSNHLKFGVFFVPHRSHVMQICFSNQQILFASFANDRELRLYSQNDSIPILVLHINLHPPTLLWLSCSPDDKQRTRLLCFERNRSAQVLHLDLNKKCLVAQKKIVFEKQTNGPVKVFFNQRFQHALLVNESTSSQVYSLKSIMPPDT